MVRFVLILAGAFNVFVFVRALAVPFHYIFKPFRAYTYAVDLVVLIAVVVFVIVHSIRLAMFSQRSLKVQTVLSSIDPFVRAFIIVAYLVAAPPENRPNLLMFAFTAVFIAFDIFIIFYLRSASVKDVFKHAAVWKEEKFRRKLMKKAVNISS